MIDKDLKTKVLAIRINTLKIDKENSKGRNMIHALNIQIIMIPMAKEITLKTNTPTINLENTTIIKDTTILSLNMVAIDMKIKSKAVLSLNMVAIDMKINNRVVLSLDMAAIVMKIKSKVVLSQDTISIIKIDQKMMIRVKIQGLNRQIEENLWEIIDLIEIMKKKVPLSWSGMKKNQKELIKCTKMHMMKIHQHQFTKK